MSTLHWRRIFQPKTLFAWDNIATRSSSSSWLDGLRGVAALQVFFFHFFGRHTAWGRPYGSTKDDYYLHQLPLFRPIWAAGSGAVSTFFVISGYAITVKSLSLLRQGNHEDLYNGLCSSLFRRGFRLFLPVILLAIPSLLVIRIFDMTDGFMFAKEVSPTIWGQIADFFASTDHHINPFSYRIGMGDNRYVYVPTSWTIPMEYYGSIVCYILMMIISRMEIYLFRTIVLVGMSVYALHRGSWWTSNFIFGMWMADQALEQKSKTVETPVNLRRLYRLMYLVLFGFGLYLSGMPPEVLAFEFAPAPKVGYKWLYKLYLPESLVQIPEKERWYWYWSGNLTFLAISKVPRLQAVFNTKFCQWLGKLSFSLYLVHAMIIAIFSRPIQGFVKAITENKGVICLVEFTIMLPVIIVLSGAVERFIDQPSVRFAKWLEGQAFRKQDRGHALELSVRPLMANGSAREEHAAD